MTDISGWMAFWLLIVSITAFIAGINLGYGAGKRFGFRQAAMAGTEFFRELFDLIEDKATQAEIMRAADVIRKKDTEALRKLGVNIEELRMP